MSDKPDLPLISQKVTLLSLDIAPDWSVSVNANFWVLLAIAAVFAIAVAAAWARGRTGWKDFEIDQAEFGAGSGKFTLKPNMVDRQVAYSIWVELSTRKIGLPIDFEHDVVVDIYDSWFAFFSITRDLIKSVPVNKVRQDSTQKIIKLSIEVLNEGLRPHLTKWQARFRRWYEYETNKTSGGTLVDPQDIQQKFPKWDDLKSDMERVNGFLMHYRTKMQALMLTG